MNTNYYNIHKLKNSNGPITADNFLQQIATLYKMLNRYTMRYD